MRTFLPSSLATIPSLLVLCSPSAIGRLVIAVIVDAVNRHAFWARSHVGNKLSEAVLPFVAHGNPAPAVVWIPLVALVKAARFHVRPDAVFGRDDAIPTESMRKLAVSDFQLVLCFKATAARSSSALERTGPRRCRFSAIAKASPVRLLRLFKSPSDNGKPSESLACQVLEIWHAGLYTKTVRCVYA